MGGRDARTLGPCTDIEVTWALRAREHHLDKADDSGAPPSFGTVYGEKAASARARAGGPPGVDSRPAPMARYPRGCCSRHARPPPPPARAAELEEVLTRREPSRTSYVPQHRSQGR